MLQSVLIFSSLILSSFGWKYCPDSNNNLKVVSFDISNCNERSCEFNANSAVSLLLKFESPEDYDKLFIEVEAETPYFKQNIPGLERDMCQDIRPACPIEKEKPYAYLKSMKIPDNIPFSLDVNAKFKVFDSSNSSLLCVELKAKINKGKEEPKKEKSNKKDKKKKAEKEEL